MCLWLGLGLLGSSGYGLGPGRYWSVLGRHWSAGRLKAEVPDPHNNGSTYQLDDLTVLSLKFVVR